VRLREKVEGGDDGTFEIDLPTGWPPPNDRAWAVVRAAGWAPATIVPDTEQRRILDEKGAILGVEVVLHRGATVEGVVRGPDGAPLRGAHVGFTVDAAGTFRDEGQAWTVTDVEGRYRLTEGDPRLATHLVVWSDASWMKPLPLACRLDVRRPIEADVDMVEGRPPEPPEPPTASDSPGAVANDADTPR
jgi:hypothetical protein